MKGIKGFPKGPQHHEWKGDDVSYKAIHGWICRTQGDPSFCEDCGSREKKRYHWANISGEYKRDPKDWKRLCVPCHAKFDGRIGEGCAASKLNEEDIKDIRYRYRVGYFSYQDLADIFDVSKSTIARVIKEQSWRHVKCSI